MTHENEVRWTTWSVYSGYVPSSFPFSPPSNPKPLLILKTKRQERWKSEGIQIGGPQSGRGVFGHWFDKDFDEHGPAGPTAFWKISNEIDGRIGDEGEDEDADEDGFWGGDEEDGEVEVEVLVLQG